jgi:hypothetical protein
MSRFVILAAVFLAMVSPAFADPDDRAGCEDSPLLARKKACHIESCDNRDSAVNLFQIGDVDENGDFKTESLEGPTTWIRYSCPETTSALPKFRADVQAAFEKDGYTVVYSGEDTNLRAVLTMRKASDWIQLTTYDQFDQEYYVFRAVTVKKAGQ